MPKFRYPCLHWGENRLAKKKSGNNKPTGPNEGLTVAQKSEIIGLIYLGLSLLIALAFVLQHVGLTDPKDLLSKALFYSRKQIGLAVLVLSLMFWTWGLERMRGKSRRRLWSEILVWLLLAVVVMVAEIFDGRGGIIGSFLTASVLIPLLGKAGTKITLVVTSLVTLILVLDISLLPWASLLLRVSCDCLKKVYAILQTAMIYMGRGIVWMWRQLCRLTLTLSELLRKDKKTEELPEPAEIDFEYSSVFEESFQPLTEATVKSLPDTSPEPADEVQSTIAAEIGQVPVEFIDDGIEDESGSFAGYKSPSLDVLDPVENVDNEAVRELVIKGSEVLLETLRHFNIEARLQRVDVGPSVVRYEIKIPPGIKVNKVTGLHDNIALALATNKVRIEAPIPGKSAIGVEVPNPAPSTVYFREIMESEDFSEVPSLLKFVVGKTITGDPVVADLTKMPHLLIGGATNSGKSVCLHSVVASFLFNINPTEVRFIMIDPKMVELSFYNGIPHLLTEVVTDPRQASIALKWVVREMDARYQLLKQYRVKNIEGFNRLVDAVSSAEADQEDQPVVATLNEKDEVFHDAEPGETGTPKGDDDEVFGLEEDVETGEDDSAQDDVEEESAGNLASLYYIVVVIDELADLMMVASRDIEEAICRLAQKARAVGIHLVIATQRPSVDVITGLIKANLPSRIAFAVSSQTDARTILDRKGAESLIGRGDMLYSPLGKPPVRVQGALIKDDEIERLVEFLKEQGEPEYIDEVMLEEDDDDGVVQEPAGGKKEDMTYRAAMVVIGQQHASTSLLQRKLRIGYGRAARIIDNLEEKRVIGPFNESRRKRDVLMTMEEFQNKYATGA